MLMTDSEIREGIESGIISMENFDEECLQPASYDMRVGDRALLGGSTVETPVAEKGGLVLEAGQFGLLTTFEKLRLAGDVAGHIAIKSYYARKGLVGLSGLQLDPGFNGVLVVGVYNAATRRLTLDHKAQFCTVEFHKLSRAVAKPFVMGDEQRLGMLPRVDEDYLRTVETQSLSEISESVRRLSENVGGLTTYVNLVVTPFMVVIFAALVAYAVHALLF